LGLPSWDRKWRQKILNIMKANLAAQKARYQAECNDPDPSPPTCPVPVPIQIPSQNPTQQKYAWVLVGTLVGTVAYWVCSEGTRVLFPPRNLIPIL
jgi:hypothetical protein